ncbi:MAG: molybdenum cofactor guanylyltransferase [Chloroflexota bacterium]|nr:MAG: molybdenum cofactor guanylyltransferase [Chloroflexota bacterium]
MSKPALTTVILAGGKSRRLGTNKALVEVGGRAILQRVAERVQPVSVETLLVVNTEEEVSLYGKVGAWRTVVDAFPDGGALGGVYTGVQAAKTDHSLVVGCDMPFLNHDLLAYIVEGSERYDVVIPRLDDVLEPLHAIYATTCLTPMRTLLLAHDRQIIKFLPQVKVRYVEQNEVERFDPRLLSFFNVNTREDLARAERLAAEGDGQ